MVLYARGKGNNGSAKILVNICVGKVENTGFFHLFTLCSASVCALVLVWSDTKMSNGI